MTYSVQMPGRNYTSLFDRAAGQYGYLTPSDARQVGVDPNRLPKLAERGTIQQIAYGLYRMPAVPPTSLDQYMEATLWPRGGGVLSHDTALDIYDLCDVNPARIHVTVPSGMRITRAVPRPYVLHHRDLPAGDVTRHEGIAIITPLRAIRDGIERHLGEHLIEQAVRTARERGLITEVEQGDLAERHQAVA
jgi:predicted transcriptional regulator of viral defense system